MRKSPLDDQGDVTPVSRPRTRPLANQAGLPQGKADDARKTTNPPHLYELPRVKERVLNRYAHVDPFGECILRLCESVTNRKRVGLQTGRHTAITWWIKQGVSIGTAADWAGNSPEVIEAHYRGRVPFSAKALSMKYFGQPFLSTGVPEVPDSLRASWMKAFLSSIS